MNVGLIGGGFGIYGYLPALVENGHNVITKEKYRSEIYSRTELSDYWSHVSFASSEKELLCLGEVIVLATHPNQQKKILEENVFRKKRIFLEKPLATSVSEHSNLIELLETQQTHFSIAYLYRYTSWFEKLEESANNASEIKVCWEIKHSNQNWKSAAFSDGGLFDFYGIHLAPLLYYAGVNIDDLEISRGGRVNELFFSIQSQKFGMVNIKLKFGEENLFNLRIDNYNHRIEFIEETPFGPRGVRGSKDSRVDLLKKYLKDSRTVGLENLEVEKFVCRVRRKAAETNKSINHSLS